VLAVVEIITDLQLTALLQNDIKIMKIKVCSFFPVVSHGSDQILQPAKKLRGLLFGSAYHS